MKTTTTFEYYDQARSVINFTFDGEKIHFAENIKYRYDVDVFICRDDDNKDYSETETERPDGKHVGLKKKSNILSVNEFIEYMNGNIDKILDELEKNIEPEKENFIQGSKNYMVEYSTLPLIDLFGELKYAYAEAFLKENYSN